MDKEQTGHPMLSILSKNPQMAATISKSIEQPVNSGTSSIRDPETGVMASMGEILELSRMLQQELDSYESFFQLFPDMNIDKKIVSGSILAPNNLFREDLNYSLDNPVITTSIVGKVVKLLQESVDKEYGVTQELRKIVENSMFDNGAHAKLILPESAVDFLINNPNKSNLRIESAKGLNTLMDKASQMNELKLLGPRHVSNNHNPKYRGEGYGSKSEAYDGVVKSADNPLWSEIEEEKKIIDKGLISISDNLDILKKSFYMESFAKRAVTDRISQQKKHMRRLRSESGTVHPVGQNTASVGRTISVGIDDKPGEINLDKLRGAIFKSAPTEHVPFTRIPRRDSLTRHSIGSCLYTDIPVECLTPIIFPGEPSRYLGFIALLDPSTGYFISRESQRQSLLALANQSGMASNGLGSRSGTGNSLASGIVEKARQNIGNPDNHTPIRYHPEIFGTLMVEEYLERLNNGIQGLKAESWMSNTHAYVMMARANAGRQTQLLYIPVEYISYFAFQHNANGTGRSLLADVANLLTLRAASLYSRVANQIKNAISITDVSVTLDPKDKNPLRSLMKISDLVMQSRAQFFPQSLHNTSDLWSWWNRAGYQLNVGEHPGLPNVKIEYNQRSHDHAIPDTGDDQYLEEMVGYSFGITPEMKDAGRGANFATSIVNQSMLFAERAHGWQQILNPQITNHVRKIVFNDSKIWTTLRKTISAEWSEILANMPEDMRADYEGLDDQDDAVDSFIKEEIIDHLSVKLPPPDVVTIQNQLEAYTNYADSVDKVAEDVLSQESLSGTIFGDDLTIVQEMVKNATAQIKRDWMRSNGFLTDLLDIGACDSENKPTSRLLSGANEFTLGVARNMIAAMKEYTAIGTKATKDIGILSGAIEPDPEEPEQEEEQQIDQSPSM